MSSSPVRVSDIPVETLEEVAPVFRVLSHRHRLRLVGLLLDERLSVGDLAERAGLAPAAVSQHLGLLRAHGVLEAEREGPSVYYRVVHPGAQAVLRCIRDAYQPARPSGSDREGGRCG